MSGSYRDVLDISLGAYISDGAEFHSGTLGEGMRAAIEEIKKRLLRNDRRVEMMTRSGNYRSPASRVMDEAIELAIEERSPYPERASFVDAGTPYTDREMKRAATDGYSVVLVSPDLSTRIFAPEEILAGSGDSARPVA